MPLARPLLVWGGILVLAIANGGLREGVLVPRFGPVAGLMVSGILLAAAVIAVSFAAIRWMRVPGRGWQVGVLWLALTLAFEFGFGRLVQGRPWTELMQAYTLAGGNLWPLVLVVIVLAPPVAQAWVRRGRARRRGAIRATRTPPCRAASRRRTRRP